VLARMGDMRWGACWSGGGLSPCALSEWETARRRGSGQWAQDVIGVGPVWRVAKTASKGARGQAGGGGQQASMTGAVGTQHRARISLASSDQSKPRTWRGIGDARDRWTVARARERMGDYVWATQVHG
jgi:hypothetical protein